MKPTVLTAGGAGHVSPDEIRMRMAKGTNGARETNKISSPGKAKAKTNADGSTSLHNLKDGSLLEQGDFNERMKGSFSESGSTVKVENKTASTDEDELIIHVAAANADSIPGEQSSSEVSKDKICFDKEGRPFDPHLPGRGESGQDGCTQLEDLYQDVRVIEKNETTKTQDVLWLVLCFFGILFSFVLYGLLLEYSTSGGRKLHELSFLFVTSSLYTVTAACGRYVRDEKPTSIPPARFAVLGLTSMGSTFCSVRSLRYVIYPIQVLAKSCKPVPVMLIGALMGKKYPFRKYINVFLIVSGVALFMGGGGGHKEETNESDGSKSSSQIIGVVLLFISLCFDGGTGAYEDKLMSVHSVGPFDLMYNIQLGKTILAGISLLVLNQVHVFMQMCQDMGFLLVALGLSGALGQVFIFVTIAKFGALTCSIIGLARKVVTLVASIYFYGHHLNAVQSVGLVVCITSMVLDFFSKRKKGGHGHGHDKGDKVVDSPKDESQEEEEKKPMLANADFQENGDIELGPFK